MRQGAELVLCWAATLNIQEKSLFPLAEETRIIGIQAASDKKSLPCGRVRYPGRN